jgi:tRNA-(ms[2]io[6]A)-hydroxylase
MEKQEKVMLGLKMATDPRWVNVVEKNISEILTDHAWCEQKAATNAITNIVKFSEFPDVVDTMTRIALEEMEHFQMVCERIKERNLVLGPERRDPYVRDLAKFIKTGGNHQYQLVSALLFAAMIEARSCERFRILSENIKDESLKEFYYELMVSEAGHYTTFIKLAKKHGEGIDVDKKWQEFLDYEASLMEKYGKEETIHG